MNTKALKQTRLSKFKHLFDNHEVAILIGGFMVLVIVDHIVRHGMQLIK